MSFRYFEACIYHMPDAYLFISRSHWRLYIRYLKIHLHSPKTKCNYDNLVNSSLRSYLMFYARPPWKSTHCILLGLACSNISHAYVCIYSNIGVIGPISDLFIVINFKSLFKRFSDFSVCDIGHGTCAAVLWSAELKYTHTHTHTDTTGQRDLSISEST